MAYLKQAVPMDFQYIVSFIDIIFSQKNLGETLYGSLEYAIRAIEQLIKSNGMSQKPTCNAM